MFNLPLTTHTVLFIHFLFYLSIQSSHLTVRFQVNLCRVSPNRDGLTIYFNRCLPSLTITIRCIISKTYTRVLRRCYELAFTPLENLPGPPDPVHTVLLRLKVVQPQIDKAKRSYAPKTTNY